MRVKKSVVGSKNELIDLLILREEEFKAFVVPEQSIPFADVGGGILDGGNKRRNGAICAILFRD